MSQTLNNILADACTSEILKLSGDIPLLSTIAQLSSSRSGSTPTPPPPAPSRYATISGGATVYTVNVTTTSGFYAMQDTVGTKTIASGSGLISNVGGSVKVWSCVSLSDVTETGDLVTFLMNLTTATGVDVSLCPALINLNVQNNPLTTLVLGASIVTLNCHNSITSLDISAFPAIQFLNCSSNIFSSLVLNNSLLTLDCSNCALTTLTIPNHAILQELDCSGNSLSSLSLTGCVALTILDCSYNSLTSLTLTGLSALTNMNCQWNAITSLNATPCTAMTSLTCDNNLLSSITITGLVSLTNLNCFYNQIATLPIATNHNLISINANYNSLNSAAVDAALVLLAGFGLSNGYVDLTTNAAPGAAGIAAEAFLYSLYWTVLTD